MNTDALLDGVFIAEVWSFDTIDASPPSATRWDIEPFEDYNAALDWLRDQAVSKANEYNVPIDIALADLSYGRDDEELIKWVSSNSNGDFTIFYRFSVVTKNSGENMNRRYEFRVMWKELK